MNKKTILCKSLMALGMVAVMASCGSKSESQSADGSSTEAVESSETSSASLDEIIDKYEEFADECIKSAASGEVSLELLQKANSLEAELVGAEGKMTPEQTQRLLTIQGKMAEALKDK